MLAIRLALLSLPFAVLFDHDHFPPFYEPRVYFYNAFLLIPPSAIALNGLNEKNVATRRQANGRLSRMDPHRA